jgi:transcriptional accessory protein Tex/SPT6
VKGVGPKTLQQAAGFLRVFGGPEPLDATPIHPESYAAAKAMQRGGAASASAEEAARLGIGIQAS